MKRHTIFASAALLLGAGPSLALEDQWGFGTITTDWYYASYTTAQRTVTLYCVNKEHQFIYGMPAKDLDPIYAKLEYVDLVLDVDINTKDDKREGIETAVAKVEVTADMIAFKVFGQRAWELQAAIGYSDIVKIGVSQRYIPENPDVDGIMVYLGNTGASQQASSYVMGPCVPEGYNDQPSSEEGDADSVSPKG